jgi:hypothetical protein
MIVGTVLVTAVLVLAMQVMDSAAAGGRPIITVASQLGIAPDRTFTDWPVVAPAIHAVLFDIPVWFLLVLAAAVLYWLTDWTDEKLGVLFGRARPPAADTLPGGSPSPQPLPHPTEVPR